MAIGIFELPDDLARVVDAEGNGGARRFGEGGEVSPAVKEAVDDVVGNELPDDLARGVDAAWSRAAVGQGIVKGGEGATAVEKPVPVTIRVVVSTDDLTRVVDAERNVINGQGIVESGEGIDWHGTASSVIAQFTESVDRKAEPVSNLLSLSCIPRAARNAARTTWIAVVFLWTRQPWQ